MVAGMAPNRIAALGTAATALVAAIVSLLGAVDTTEKAIVVSVALVVAGLVAAVWLLGWQKVEARSGTVVEREGPA